MSAPSWVRISTASSVGSVHLTFLSAALLMSCSIVGKGVIYQSGTAELTTYPSRFARCGVLTHYLAVDVPDSTLVLTTDRLRRWENQCINLLAVQGKELSTPLVR